MKNGSRLITVAAVVVCVAIFFWLLPPFHIVRLSAATSPTTATFDAAAFVEQFWSQKLLASIERATDAGALLDAIQRDPKAARQKHARSLGLSETYYYFIKGEGRVIAADARGVSLAVRGTSAADVVLKTGNIFGNAVRDGTGLLNVNDFADSQDFNAISAQLNQRVEQRVLPKLAGLKPGQIVQFAGCAQVDDENTDLKPLQLIPIAVTVR